MPDAGNDGVVGAREARDRVEQDQHVLLVLDEALGLFDHHLGDLHVALRRLVERRRDHLAVDRSLHVGDFFRTLVDQQDDQVDLGVVLRHRLRDGLQQHGLAGARRRDDQSALALAERRHQVHDARRQVLGLGLELDALERIERREVFEEQLVARLVGRLEVDGFDLDQREVALAFLRRPDLPRDRVAGLQVELAYLGGGNVDVVGARQVVVVGRAQEAEAVGQHFEHAFREDEPALLGLRLEDLEDQLLLAHAGRAGDLEILGDLGEVLDAHLLQLGDVEAGLLASRSAAACSAASAATSGCGGG